MARGIGPSIQQGPLALVHAARPATSAQVVSRGQWQQSHVPGRPPSEQWLSDGAVSRPGISDSARAALRLEQQKRVGLAMAARMSATRPEATAIEAARAAAAAAGRAASIVGDCALPAAAAAASAASAAFGLSQPCADSRLSKLEQQRLVAFEVSQRLHGHPGPSVYAAH